MNDRTAADDDDGAKAKVLAEVDRLVTAGGARRVVLRNGEIEIRLASGEVFHFGETLVTRVA